MSKDLKRNDDLIKKYDAVCKEILSQKIILAWIMKDCMWEYSDYSPIEIARLFIENDSLVSGIEIDAEDGGWMPRIQGNTTEDASLFEGRITYDIRFTAMVPGNEQRIWIDLEPQKDFYPGYSLLKRGGYYLARMISAQRGREFIGSDYDKLKKAYTIWICLNPPKKWEHRIKYYEVKDRDESVEIGFGLDEYDLMTQVVICLGDPMSPRANGVLKLLSVLFTNIYDSNEKQRILEEEFGIALTETMRKGLETMCNFGEGIYEQGMAQGMVQGTEQGFAKGTLNVNFLYRLLTKEQRFDDLQKAINDDSYLNRLLDEYSLVL